MRVYHLLIMKDRIRLSTVIMEYYGVDMSFMQINSLLLKKKDLLT